MNIIGFRLWLIKLLVGKRPIVMNAKVYGSIHCDSAKQGGLVMDCEFHPPYAVGYERIGTYDH